MIVVDNFLRVDIDDLRKTEWEKIFKKLRYVDVGGNLFESWRVNMRIR